MKASNNDPVTDFIRALQEIYQLTQEKVVQNWTSRTQLVKPCYLL